MTYKTKVTVLGGIIAALALVLIFSFIFDSDRVSTRSSVYSWLDIKQKDRISTITIYNQEDTVFLTLRNGNWLVKTNERDFPALNLKVDDFINTLTKKAQYPVRSSSALSHEKYFLTEERNSGRVTVSDDSGLPLLDLLIGFGDITRQNIYLRKHGQNEVRSGEDIFSTYVITTPAFWYNLRLFPEAEAGKVDITGVQRFAVYPPAVDGESPAPLVFSRNNRTWNFNFNLENPDPGMVDLYIRDILNASADGFADIDQSEIDFNDCRIFLEFGDNTFRSLRLSVFDLDSERRYAVVSGSNFVYSIPEHTFRRLFPDISYFERGF